MKKLIFVLSILFIYTVGFGLTVKLGNETTFYCLMISSDSAVNGKTGILTPTIYRTNGTASSQITTAVWTEIDSTNMKGLYGVGLRSADFPSIGEYVFYITSPTCVDFRKTFEVVTNIESDVIAQVQASTQGVNVASNDDKTGYTVSTNLDKTEYQLIGGVTVQQNLDKNGYTVLQGTVTVTNNKDKDGYTIIQGTVTVTNNKDKTGYSGTLTEQVTSYAIVNWNVTESTCTKLNDKSGITATLTGDVTAYRLLNYDITQATVTKITDPLIKQALSVFTSSAPKTLEKLSDEIKTYR